MEMGKTYGKRTYVKHCQENFAHEFIAVIQFLPRTAGYLCSKHSNVEGRRAHETTLLVENLLTIDGF